MCLRTMWDLCLQLPDSRLQVSLLHKILPPAAAASTAAIVGSVVLTSNTSSCQKGIVLKIVSMVTSHWHLSLVLVLRPGDLEGVRRSPNSGCGEAQGRAP